MNLAGLLLDSIETLTDGLDNAALLFSGGVDSSLLALLLKDRVSLRCYCAGAGGSHDLALSERSAKALGIELIQVEFTIDDVKRELPRLRETVGDNMMKLGVATPFWMCMPRIGEGSVFLGTGTEELFAGYDRHRRLLPDYRAIDEECRRGLATAWERDVSRDTAVCAAFGKKALFPYLDKAFAEAAMALPAERKISADGNKLALRELAVELGLPKEIAFAPKKAAQYGSGADKMLRKALKDS